VKKTAELIPVERIQNFIFLIRGEKVLLGQQLAELYGVETKALNRAVKRNADRFPNDFMFQLSKVELENLRCQIGTSSLEYGGRRYQPYVFFDLTGHPEAKRAYAWSHLDGQNDERTRFVAVLEIPPVVSAETAVRVQIVKDFKKG